MLVEKTINGFITHFLSHIYQEHMLMKRNHQKQFGHTFLVYYIDQKF